MNDIVYLLKTNASPHYKYATEPPAWLHKNVLTLTNVLSDRYALVYTFDVDGIGHAQRMGWYCRRSFPNDIKHIFVPYPGEDVIPEDFEKLLDILEL